MKSQQRAAWLIGICFVLGLGAAYVYWPQPPRKLNAFQREQRELARQNEELAQQAAKALPQALPNAAPGAVIEQGPAGKVLPVRLKWQDKEGASGGILKDLDGCIMAGPGVDVFWEGGDLFVMKQKGRLRRVWTAGKIDSPYGPMHRGHLAYVCYDGKFVWASMLRSGMPAELVVLNPQSEQTWEFGAEDAPRNLGNSAPQQRNAGFAIAPWAPGKVAIAGWPGVTWLAMLSFDPEQGKKVEPLPEPVDLERKRSELLPADQQRLLPAGMWAVDGEKPLRRLLIGRANPPRFTPPAWSVEPEASRFEGVGGASLGAAMQMDRFTIGDGGLYWLEHAPAANPRTVLVRAQLPELAEQVVMTDVPDGHPAFHDGWLWVLGDPCWRRKLGEEQIQSIPVDVPWQVGFRKPGEATGRNDAYYNVRRVFPSEHYGLLVTTYLQDSNAYGQTGKFFQFGLADDPRLKSEPPGDQPSAAGTLAADATPGTIESQLELVAPMQDSEDRRPVAFLGPALELGDVPEDVGLPILAREIVRQSLLSAARDGLGWLTRDAVLRETLPDEKRESAAQFTLTMRFSYRAPAVFELRRLGPQGKSEPVWKEELEIYPAAEIPCQYGKLVEAAERWSREVFPPLLEQAGLPKTPAAPAGGGAVPESAEKQLEQVNFTSQFMAIEELHDALRRQGKSEAVVGALVRGYANLGVLTEYHWTAGHKACKARALLYAQRLVAAAPASRLALWHRAYAEALTGIHNAAQDDLAAAAKLAQAPPADAAQDERPRWVDLIAAFCRFDDERLAEAANNERYGQLAGLLQFIVMERLKHSESVQALMERLLAKNPECFRVHDARSSSGPLGTLHGATLEAPALLEATLPKRLREVQGLPLGVARLLGRREASVDELARALSAVGPEEDGDELSWRMLGDLIQETQFMQCLRRASFMRNSWSVPADDYVQSVAPLIARHRYRALLDLYRTTPQPQAAAELEQQLDLSELDFEQQAEFERMLGGGWETRETEQYLAAVKRPEQHMDDVHRDFFTLWASLDGKENKSPKSEIIRRMRKLSPDSPDIAAAWIGVQGGAVEAVAPELEQRFARKVQVWQALVHAGAREKEVRIRRLRKCIELSHDFWAYEMLAGIYHQDRQYDEWLAVLEDYLKQPSRGLEHDHVRAQIAGHYMRSNEWDKALPYALEAAQSGAAWAMGGVADCYEGLGDDQNEGLWRAQLAERYAHEEDALTLYFWARRTGLGDAKALASRLDQIVSGWAETAPLRGQHRVGVFYQLSGRPEQALTAFQKAAKDRSELSFMYTAHLRAALVAHELENVQARDQALKALKSIRDPALAAYQKIGDWLEGELARPKGEPPDLTAARMLVAGAEPSDRPSLNYAIGRCLQLRERTDDAKAFLDAAASSAQSRTTLSRVLASAALRDRGLTPSKLKTEPIPIFAPDGKPVQMKAPAPLKK